MHPNDIRRNCRFCNMESSAPGIGKHEKYCYLNPVNLTLCPICNGPIKDYKHSTTCSVGCSNTYFRSGPNNPNFGNYRTVCFHHHSKACVVCGELNIVAVHHLDSDNTNNTPENLIPLCPTHHCYWHSRYRHLIEDKVFLHIEKYKDTSNLTELHPY